MFVVDFLFLQSKMQLVQDEKYGRFVTNGNPKQVIYTILTKDTAEYYIHNNGERVGLNLTRHIHRTCAHIAIQQNVVAIATHDDQLFIYKKTSNSLAFLFAKYLLNISAGPMCIIDNYLIIDQVSQGCLVNLTTWDITTSPHAKGYLTHTPTQVLYGKGSKVLIMIDKASMQKVLTISEPIVAATFKNSLFVVATDTYVIAFDRITKHLLHRWTAVNIVNVAIVGHMLLAVKAVQFNVVTKPSGVAITELCDPNAANVLGYDLTTWQLIYQMPINPKRIVRQMVDLGRGQMLAGNVSLNGYGHWSKFKTINYLQHEVGPLIVAARRLHRTLPLELLEKIVSFL
jgi:hypothetical protein